MFAVWACVAAATSTALVVCWTHLERGDWRRVIEREDEEEEAEMDAASTGAAAGLAEHEDAAAARPAHAPEDPHRRRVRARGLHALGTSRQLRTREYALAALFASCQMVRCNFFIMTADDYLAGLGDADAAYASTFGWVLPCGVVFVPVIERTVRELGVLRSLHFANGLGLVFGLLLEVPSLRAQLLNFAVFAGFRAYLYAVLNTFVALTFGPATMGRMIGCVFTTAAVVSLAQYPLAVWTSVDRDGDYAPANAVLALLGVAPVVAIVWYERSLEDEKEVPVVDATRANGAKENYGSFAAGISNRRSSLLDGGASSVLASPGSPSLDEVRRQRGQQI